MKMRTMIMILALALAIPLSAQSTATDMEVSKDEQQRFAADSRSHQTEPIAVRKYREQMRRGMDKRQMADKRQKMQKKQQIKNIVRLAVVGGLAYYIGYHQGEEHFNGGMKRRPYFGDRK